MSVPGMERKFLALKKECFKLAEKKDFAALLNTVKTDVLFKNLGKSGELKAEDFWCNYLIEYFSSDSLRKEQNAMVLKNLLVLREIIDEAPLDQRQEVIGKFINAPEKELTVVGKERSVPGMGRR